MDKGTGETRGSAKVQIATESLCKRAKVEVIRGRVEKGAGGRGKTLDYNFIIKFY